MKSSFCNFGDCVEVEFEGETVRVGQSGELGGLRFTREEWGAFIQGVKAGEFDLPEVEE